MVDAVQWTHTEGLIVGIIFSPNNAREQYDEWTLDYLTYLTEHDALPAVHPWRL